MKLMPYDTTICRIYKGLAPKLKTYIDRAQIHLPLPMVFTPSGELINNCYFVSPQDSHEEVPSFTQYVNVGNQESPKLVIDSRQYMRYDERFGTYKLIANNDWTFQCIRMALNEQLLLNGVMVFNRLTDLPAKVFHRWVSGALVHRFGLNIESQMVLYVITAYYYYAMLNPELVEPDEETRISYANNISRVTGVPINYVLDTIADMGQLGSAEDLVTEIAKSARSVSVEKLNFSELYALLSSSWFGTNARENVGVALEHLPTYIAMLYMAVSDRSYRKSVITQRAESVSRGNDIKAFVDLVFNAVSQQFVME